MTTIQCETVEVSISGCNSTITIPAYTRPVAEFSALIAGHLAEYVGLSQRVGNAVSVGDFALRLIALASQEPRTQEVTR